MSRNIIPSLQMHRRLFQKVQNYSTFIQSRSDTTKIPWYEADKLYKQTDLASETDVREFLLKNKIFENEHIISYNKPAGVHVFSAYNRKNKSRYSSGDTDSTETHSIEDIMHLIAHENNCPSLQLCKSPPPDYSGVMLFAKSEDASKAIRNAFWLAKKAGKYVRTDLALTIGVPHPHTDIIKVAVETRKVDGRIVTVPVLHPSSAKLRSKVIRPKRTFYEVLDTMRGMSLVKVQPRDGLGQLSLLHISCKMCQVLGDKQFSNRIVNINGVKMFLDPEKVEVGTQKLSPKLMRQLLLDNKQLENLPLHMHRWKITLPPNEELNLPNTLDITAPLPKYFAVALQLLDLKLPEEQ